MEEQDWGDAMQADNEAEREFPHLLCNACRCLVVIAIRSNHNQIVADKITADCINMLASQKTQ